HRVVAASGRPGPLPGQGRRRRPLGARGRHNLRRLIPRLADSGRGAHQGRHADPRHEVRNGGRRVDRVPGVRGGGAPRGGRRWGTPETLTIPFFVQSQEGDDAYLRWMNRFERLSSTPANLLAIMALNAQIDVRHVLPAISASTLVLHARQDRAVPIENGRYLAAHIPGARLVEYDGEHIPTLAGVDESLDAIERFITGAVHSPAANRVLAT